MGYRGVGLIPVDIGGGCNLVASNPGFPHPDFITIFLQGCEIKSGRGRPWLEASNLVSYQCI